MQIGKNTAILSIYNASIAMKCQRNGQKNHSVEAGGGQRAPAGWSVAGAGGVEAGGGRLGLPGWRAAGARPPAVRRRPRAATGGRHRRPTASSTQWGGTPRVAACRDRAWRGENEKLGKRSLYPAAIRSAARQPRVCVYGRTPVATATSVRAGRSGRSPRPAPGPARARREPVRVRRWSPRLRSRTRRDC